MHILAPWHWRVNSSRLFSELGWLTVFERVEFNKGILLYKALHNLCPEYITDMFKFKSSSYGLRSSSNQQISIPKHNYELFKNLICILEQLYGIISLWSIIINGNWTRLHMFTPCIGIKIFKFGNLKILIYLFINLTFTESRYCKLRARTDKFLVVYPIVE